MPRSDASGSAVGAAGKDFKHLYRNSPPYNFLSTQILNPHLSKLKKDKERLQAMMAHLKSSEPKAAAQPVSTCCAVSN